MDCRRWPTGTGSRPDSRGEFDPCHDEDGSSTRDTRRRCYEAEAAGNTFSGKVAADTCTSCSGSKKVRFIGAASANFLVINQVAAATAGARTLTIYPVLSGTRSLSLSVNGGTSKTLSATGSDWQKPGAAISTSVTLKAGNNTIKIFNNTANAPDIDRVTVQ